MKLRVSFDYYPDEPDEGDATGMSSDEHDRLTEGLMMLGADDIQFEKYVSTGYARKEIAPADFEVKD